MNYADSFYVHPPKGSFSIVFAHDLFDFVDDCPFDFSPRFGMSWFGGIRLGLWQEALSAPASSMSEVHFI